jgi:S1-C subfamily serine protease
MLSFRTSCLIFLCALLSGCASMMNAGKQSLTINSSPQGALVYENGAEVGTTPYTYTYDKPEGGTVSLELRKEGLENRIFEITPSKKNSILLMDALLFNIPYYAGDNKSTALYAFPQKELLVNLYRDIPEDVQVSDLPIVTLENKIAAKSVIGKFGTKKLTTESREFSDLEYPDQITSNFISGLKGTYVNVQSVRLSTQKGDESVRRSKVYLKPVLRSIDAQLTELDKRAYGTVDTYIEWKFMSGIDKDSVLFSYDKKTRYPVFAENVRDVLASAAKDAARQLLDEPDLRERLSKSFDIGLTRSKGSIVQLSKPKAISYTGRKDMMAALVKAVVTIETNDGHGSGFLVTNDGYLITNAHVVEDQSTVKVRFEQGFTLDGTVVKVNKDFDVALVKTSASDLPALTVGDDASLQLGEELFAVGTPLDQHLGQTVTRGIMSGKREFEGRSFLQTDVSINPGNSGGPLIDETGRVVGVATLKVSETGVQGIGFGVPMSKALEMLNIEFLK